MIRWMAWRLHRRGLIGFGVGGFLISFFYGGAFTSAAGTTAASQAAFGRSVNLVAKQFAFIIPVPTHPETLGGYEQYKWLSGAIILMMIWAAITGVGVGSQRRGSRAHRGVDRGRSLAGAAPPQSQRRLRPGAPGGLLRVNDRHLCCRAACPPGPQHRGRDG